MQNDTDRGGHGADPRAADAGQHDRGLTPTRMHHDATTETRPRAIRLEVINRTSTDAQRDGASDQAQGTRRGVQSTNRAGITRVGAAAGFPVGRPERVRFILVHAVTGDRSPNSLRLVLRDPPAGWSAVGVVQQWGDLVGG